jgi:hypothetical protein
MTLSGHLRLRAKISTLDIEHPDPGQRIDEKRAPARHPHDYSWIARSLFSQTSYAFRTRRYPSSLRTQTHELYQGSKGSRGTL